MQNRLIKGLLYGGGMIVGIGLLIATHAGLLWLLQLWPRLDIVLSNHTAYLWWGVAMLFFPLPLIAAILVVDQSYRWIKKRPLPNAPSHPLSVALGLFALGLYLSQWKAQFPAVHLSTLAIITLAVLYTGLFYAVYGLRPIIKKWMERW